MAVNLDAPPALAAARLSIEHRLPMADGRTHNPHRFSAAVAQTDMATPLR
jgi:hypothetical protein